MAVVIGHFSTAGAGSVNTFWIETGAGVVVVDGQRELSTARAALARIARGGRPVVAAVVTHPHPDHFGGIGVLAPPGSGVPVHASRQTHDSIAEDRHGLVEASHDVVGDDFPDEPRLPDHVLSDGDELDVGGVRLVAHEMGPSEAECMTVLHLPEERILLAGDVIQNGMTPYLLEGRSGAWLAQLEQLRSRFPDVRVVHPGHGEAGPLDELVGRQIDYLTTFRAAVADELTHGGGELASGGAERVAEVVRTRYPDHVPVAAIPDLLVRNVAPVAAELVAERARGGPVTAAPPAGRTP